MKLIPLCLLWCFVTGCFCGYGGVTIHEKLTEKSPEFESGVIAGKCFEDSWGDFFATDACIENFIEVFSIPTTNGKGLWYSPVDKENLTDYQQGAFEIFWGE